MARQIVVEIIGDKSRFSSTLDGAARDGGKFGNVMTGIGQGIGQGIARGAGMALSAVTDFVGGSITHASNLEQSVGAVESVFGSASGTIINFGRDAADSYGLSARQVNESGAVFGAMLQSMGFEADEAAGHTINLTERAADMAATFGGPTSGALEAIGALMRGERDPIERFGVSIKQADVNAEMLARGLNHLEGEERRQAEALVVMDLMMQQTAATEGAFARESDTLAGQQARSAAEFENVSAALGEKLQPIMIAVFGFVNDTALPALMNLINWLQETWKSIEPGVKALAQQLQPAFQNVSKFLTGTIIPVLTTVAKVVLPILWGAINFVGQVVGNVFGFISRFISSNMGTIQGVIRTAQHVFSTVWNAISGYVRTAVTNIGGFIRTVQTTFGNVVKTVNTVRDGIRSAFNNVVSFIGGLPGRIGRMASGMWNGLWNSFRGAINSIIRAWNNLGFNIPSFTFAGITVGGFHIGTPNLPYLHAGGIVPGVPGTDVPAVLQAGERVLPRSRSMGGGGITIHIDHWYGSDNADLDRFADRIAQRIRLSGAF